MNAIDLLKYRLGGQSQPAAASPPPADDMAWIERAIQGGAALQQSALPEGLPDIVRQSILNQPSYSEQSNIPRQINPGDYSDFDVEFNQRDPYERERLSRELDRPPGGATRISAGQRPARGGPASAGDAWLMQNAPFPTQARKQGAPVQWADTVPDLSVLSHDPASYGPGSPFGRQMPSPAPPQPSPYDSPLNQMMRGRYAPPMFY